MSNLLLVPQEILEEVIKLLDHKSAINLLHSCGIIYSKLEGNVRFWRHICQDFQLTNTEWMKDGCEESQRSVQSLKELYFNKRRIQNRLKGEDPLETERIHLDINSFRWGKRVKDHQKIVKWPRPKREGVGFMTLKKELIAENIFSVGVSEKFFVLILSNCQTFKSHISVWKLESGRVKFSYALTPTTTPYHLLPSLWLGCSEDLLVQGHLLILLASQAEQSNFFNEAQPCPGSPMLHVFDLNNEARLVGTYSPPRTYTRLLPLILKEGGGTRLIMHANYLLAVCPEVGVEYYTVEHEVSPRCVLRMFDLGPCMESEGHPQGADIVHQLECVEYYEVKGVMLRQPGAFMASDQKGPNIVLSFSKQMEGREALGQQILTLNIEERGGMGHSVRVYTQETEGFKRLPLLVGEGDIVSRREGVLIAASQHKDVFALMDASGVVLSKDLKGIVRNFIPVYGISEDWDTFFDELHLYQGNIVCMKTFQNRDMNIAGSKTTVLSVSSMSGNLLWKVNLTPGGGIDRFFLSPMFGNIFVSDARKAFVYCASTGHKVTVLQFPLYKRISKEMEVGETSPYAQTGFSVWDIRRIGDSICIVHDIERVNPVIADFISIC